MRPSLSRWALPTEATSLNRFSNRCAWCRIYFAGERCPVCLLSPHMAEVMAERDSEGRDYDPGGAR